MHVCVWTYVCRSHVCVCVVTCVKVRAQQYAPSSLNSNLVFKQGLSLNLEIASWLENMKRSSWETPSLLYSWVYRYTPHSSYMSSSHQISSIPTCEASTLSTKSCPEPSNIVFQLFISGTVGVFYILCSLLRQSSFLGI